jgi:hypothetical protein
VVHWLVPIFLRRHAALSLSLSWRPSLHITAVEDSGSSLRLIHLPPTFSSPILTFGLDQSTRCMCWLHQQSTRCMCWLHQLELKPSTALQVSLILAHARPGCATHRCAFLRSPRPLRPCLAHRRPPALCHDSPWQLPLGWMAPTPSCTEYPRQSPPHHQLEVAHHCLRPLARVGIRIESHMRVRVGWGMSLFSQGRGKEREGHQHHFPFFYYLF